MKKAITGKGGNNRSEINLINNNNNVKGVCKMSLIEVSTTSKKKADTRGTCSMELFQMLLTDKVTLAVNEYETSAGKKVTDQHRSEIEKKKTADLLLQFKVKGIAGKRTSNNDQCNDKKKVARIEKLEEQLNSNWFIGIDNFLYIPVSMTKKADIKTLKAMLKSKEITAEQFKSAMAVLKKELAEKEVEKNRKQKENEAKFLALVEEKITEGVLPEKIGYFFYSFYVIFLAIYSQIL